MRKLYVSLLASLLVAIAIITPQLAHSSIAKATTFVSQSGHPIVKHRSTKVHWVPRYYRVRSGDSLSKIAKLEYGNSGYWPTLWDYNWSVANPNLIYVGQRLWIPYRPTTAMRRHMPQSHGHVVVTSYHPQGSIYADVQEIFGSGTGCAVEILDHESGLSWSDVTVSNPSSGAYGLPQALPGYKMASFGSDWMTDPITQLRWMLWYVNASYSGVCNAANHDLTVGWY